MKTKIESMKAMVRNLNFDRKLVRTIKKAKVDEGVLYNQLISGRITLKEYLNAA